MWLNLGAAGWISLAVLILWYIGDNRVYDVKGKRLPGSLSHFQSPNLLTLLIARRNNNSQEMIIRDSILQKCGNGNMACFNLPFSSFDICNLFRTRIVLISDPDMVKSVLLAKATIFPKSSKYLRLKFALGDGLLTAPIPIWQASRAALNPRFHASALKEFTGIFLKRTNHMLAMWDEKLDKTSIGIIRLDNYDEVCALTLGIICQSVFSLDLTVGTPEFESVYQDERNLAEEMDLR